jgi:hypothetical protein
MPRKVFINYRRADTKALAGRIADRFAAMIGKQNVFFDISTIKGGDDFEARITAAIDEAAVFLVIVGPHWLECFAAPATLAAREDFDYVQWEIRAALGCGKRVVPLLIDGATMPVAADLPADIVGLATRNAMTLRHETFDRDFDHLCRSTGLGAPDRASLARALAGAVLGAISAFVVCVLVALIHRQITGTSMNMSIGDLATVLLLAGGVLLGAGTGWRLALRGFAS